MENCQLNPQHYQRGGLEAIDVIEAFGLNFSRGAALKYILRAGHKEDELLDLEKAAWFLAREIARLRNKSDFVKEIARLRVKMEPADTKSSAPVEDEPSRQRLMEAASSAVRPGPSFLLTTEPPEIPQWKNDSAGDF